MCLPRKRDPATPLRAALIMASGEISVVMILFTVSQPDKASTEAESSKTSFRRNFGENIFSLKLKKQKNRQAVSSDCVLYDICRCSRDGK